MWGHCTDWSFRGKEGRGRRVWSAVLTDYATLCLCVCCGALSDCVYFSEGRFTSGSLGMNGELISPTETSQSLHIYSPPLQWPLPGQAHNGTLVNCRWVWLKGRPYIAGTSILLQKLSEIKEKCYIRQRPLFYSVLQNYIYIYIFDIAYFYASESIQCLFHVSMRYSSGCAWALDTERMRVASSERGWSLAWLHS